MGFGLGAIAIFLIALSAAYIRFTLARIRYDERREAASGEAVDKAIGELSSTPSRTELMAVNQLQMNQYRDIALHQAKNAYRNCQIAMTVGLLIIVADPAAVIALKDPASKFVLVGVGIVGASFAAYITRTFLNVYNSAAEQYRRVSSQLLMESYYLWIERISSALPEELRNQQFIKVIDNLLLQVREYARHAFAASSRRRGLPGRLTSFRAEVDKGTSDQPWLGEELPPGMRQVWLSWQNRQAVQGSAQELGGPSDAGMYSPKDEDDPDR
jgi:hypothetical protein